MGFKYLASLKREFSGYNMGKLLKDLLAGMTVAAVALPLALAFGVSSGADAASGLITAIIAGVIISMLSGAYYQISGPTGAMAAILMSIAARYQMQGVFLATLMAGILLLLAGVFRLGKLTSCIPAPVITGFTSGISIIIALGQLDNFFGVTSRGETALQKLMSYGELGFVPHAASCGIGLFVVLFMCFFPKKWNTVFPSSLAGIILATMLSVFLQLDVATVGSIPQTLFLESRLHVSGINWEQLQGVAGPAVSIAMLGMIESLLCGASAGRMAKAELDSNQELIAQGIGNILLPFFGGIPSTAAIARTSVAIKSGAQTRLTGVFHAAGLLVSMLALAPVMSRIPLSALAGVLMVTAWRMNEWKEIRFILTHKFKGATLKFLLTMAATVIFDLTMAIVIGVTAGLVLFILRSSVIEVAVEDVDLARAGVDGVRLAQDGAVVYITGPLFFMTADTLRKKLGELSERDMVIFSMRGVPSIDITAVGVLTDYYRSASAEGKQVIFSSVQPAVMHVLERSGLVEEAGVKAFYFSVDKVLMELL